MAMRAAYGWYLVIGLMLALLAPRDILSRVPLLDALVGGVAEVIPAVDRFPRVSSFPEVTRLFFAAMWVLFPVATLWFAWRLPVRPQLTTKQRWLVYVVAPLIGLGMLLLTFWFDSDPEPKVSYTSGRGQAFVALMSDWRLGLGIFGSLSLIATSFCFGGWLKYICKLFLPTDARNE